MKQLTPRERQVLELLSVGNSEKEIAYELDMKQSTVNVHIRNIKEKTGLQKATELVSLYYCSVPVINIPEKIKRVIASVLLGVAVFGMFQQAEMLRQFASRNITVRTTRARRYEPDCSTFVIG